MMLLNSVLSALLLLQASPASIEASQEPTTPQPSLEQSAEVQPPASTAATQAQPAAKITDKRHPDYVRCRSKAVIGSRAKRKRTCMTNREWALADRKTNERSAEFMGDNFAAGLY